MLPESECTTFRLEKVTLSFVVQDENYKEIIEFEKLKDKLKNIPNLRTHYHKITQWGHMTDKVFEQKAVWKKGHKNYGHNKYQENYIKLYDFIIPSILSRSVLLITTIEYFSTCFEIDPCTKCNSKTFIVIKLNDDVSGINIKCYTCEKDLWSKIKPNTENSITSNQLKTLMELKNNLENHDLFSNIDTLHRT